MTWGPPRKLEITPKTEREERPVAHKKAIELLEKDVVYLVPMLRLYHNGTVVPAKDIPKLIDAFESAKRSFDIFYGDTISNLKAQAEENKKNKEGREEG